MIIPALVNLYDRLAADPESDIAPKGYSRQQISFKVVLNKNGTRHAFERVSVTNTRETRKKVKGEFVVEKKTEEKPARLIVPGQSKPSGSGLNPCLLWDNSAYMLGYKPEDPKPERTREAFKAFREKHIALLDEIKDDGFRAVCKFLESWNPAEAASHKELAEYGTNFGVFQLRADAQYIHERPAVRAWWDENGETQDDGDDESRPDRIPSLTNGEPSPIARLHEPKIKGVMGAQSSGAAIVSFNQSAFTSYGKDQGDNAPVSIDGAFKYCTALNTLTTDDRHRVRIAGDTYVFWSEASADADTLAVQLFAAAIGDHAAKDEVTAERLRGVMESVRAGLTIKEFRNPAAPFYILGLSPNMSRLSIRLWLVSTIGEMVQRISDHQRGLAIEPSPNERPDLSIRRMVNETAPPKGGFPDSDRVIPTLAANVTRSILMGSPYPRSLFVGVLDRARIEGLADSKTRNDSRDAQHRRCAIIRACLTRNHKMEVPVALDPERNNPPYQLGRLFAVLERTQEDSIQKRGEPRKTLNRTIKDSFYGAACSTPASIFPRLLKLKNHHINKIEVEGWRVKREIQFGEIMDRITSFPRLLGLEDQGLFAIGYYHQRQSYFPKKDEADESTQD